MKCRHCGVELTHTFIDLGSSPLSNSYLTETTIRLPERWYPLRVLVCDLCWLVQTEDIIGADEIFSEDYAYFSSYSSSWLNHVKTYIDNVVVRFNLGDQSTVVEVGANEDPCPLVIQPTRGHGGLIPMDLSLRETRDIPIG